MTGYIVLICLIIFAALVCMTASFVGHANEDRDLEFFMAISFALLVLLTILLISDWDRKVMENANSFFKTRDEVYRCDGLTDEICKYKKLIWQQDSTIWQTKLNQIIQQ